MIQIWKNWFWRLFLVATIATTTLVLGNDALADNWTKLIPEQMGMITKIGMQPPIVLSLPTNSYLRLTSIRNSSTSPGQVYVKVQETGKTVGPLSISPGQELALNLDSCFSNLATVLFLETNTDFEGQQTVSAVNTTTTPLNYGSFKVNYQVSQLGCP